MKNLGIAGILIGISIRALAQFSNPGVYSQTTEGILYEWIPSENISVEVKQGKVNLIAPSTKKSWNGKNDCTRYLLGDLYDNRLPAKEEEALFGDGLKLTPGNYAFRVIYLNASSWEHARAHLWNLFGMGSGTDHDNSAMMETLYLSITAEGSPEEGVKVPADLLRASFLPHYQLLPYSLNLPADKAFGTTRYIIGVPPGELFGKMTHLQYVYSWLDSFPAGKKWKNIQAYNHSGELAQPDWVIEHTTIDPDYITLAELAENYGNLENDCPRCYDKAESVFKGVYARYQKELGITSPAQTRLYDDYFAGLYGYSFQVSFDQMPVSQLTGGLASVENARKRYYDGSWYTSEYFNKGAYSYRNYRLDGYLGNLFHTLTQGGVYQNIYNLEKANLAVPDRKLLKNGSAFSEGLHMDLITISGTFQRLKLGTGDVMRLAGYDFPLHTMMAESFYQLLLGNDYILWNSNIPMNPDPGTFRQSWQGGQDDWKTRWQPLGKPAVTYQPGAPDHPKMIATNDRSQFPEMTLQGETGAFIGAWLYSQISGVSDRVSKSVKYCPFRVNGKTITPLPGSTGDAALSSRVKQNPGQSQIVKNYEDKLPVCICTEGRDGKAIIYQNPVAGLTEVQELQVGEQFRATVTDNRLHVFYD